MLQQLYNIINSLVVTYYIGGDAFAALGVAESVMNLFIYVITGACMGSSVLVARFFGEENFPRLRQQLFVSGVLIGGTVLAAVSLTLLFLNPLLVLIQTPPELMGYVTDYLRIILVGMVFTFAYNYLAATLRAIGNTQAALFFLLISLGYNLGAAWVLVAQLGLGIQGTALATSSAQLLSALLCLVYIRKKQPFLMIQRSDMRMDPTLMRLTTWASSSYRAPSTASAPPPSPPLPPPPAWRTSARPSASAAARPSPFLWPRTRGQKNTAGLWTASGTELSWWWGSAWYSLSC